MGSLLSYSGLSTKVRAMQSKLIKEVQYQEIAQMPSVTAIVSYLKKQPGFQDLWADLDETASTEEILKGFLLIPFIKILPSYTASLIRNSEPLWHCILNAMNWQL